MGSEENFYQLANTLEDHFWILDFETKELIYNSPKFQSIFGLEEQEFIKEGFLSLIKIIHKDDKRKVTENLISVYKKDGKQNKDNKVNIKYRIYHSTKGLRWIWTRTYPVYNNYHSMYRLIGISEDITKEKEYEELLQQNNNFLQTLIDNIPVGIFVISYPEEIFTIWNPTAEKYFGFPKKTVLNQKLFEVENMNSIEFFRRFSDFYFNENQFFLSREESFTNNVGENYVFLTSKIAVVDERNELVFILCIAEDITISKTTEDILIEAKQKAEEANKLKSSFITNMSHEFRTPLNGILGYTQILKKDHSLNENQQKGLKIIEKSGNHLLNLINDILDLSKIESQKIELQQGVFYLQDSIENSIASLKLKAKEKGLEFIYNKSDELPHKVFGDEKRLTQILLNLLSNAIKFTNTGRIVLNVFREDRAIKFVVEDTGIGIPQDKLEEIFDPFKQLSPQLYKSEGTGLGLSISKRLVQLMGSELKVESQIGKGSRFSFSIFFNDVEGDISEEFLFLQRIEGYIGNTKKILIVDDIELNRVVLREILSGLGFELFEAIGGNDGILKAVKHNPDLILMDIIMPDIDGFECLNRIRNKSITSKVIAVSASVTDDFKNETRQKGFDDFLMKPIDVNNLLGKIQEQLNIHWVFKDKNHTKNNPNPKDINFLPDDKYVLPTADETNEIYKLILKGDIHNLSQILTQIEYANPACVPFLKRIKEYIEDFQLKELREFVEEYRK